MSHRRVAITLGSREAAELARMVSRGWDEMEVDQEENGQVWLWKASARTAVQKVMQAARDAR